MLRGVPTPTRIEKLTVAGCDAVDLYHPANLLPGEPFRIVGRRLGKDDKLQIVYQIQVAGGELQSQRVVLTPAASDQDHLVGRYWATQRLRHLQRLLAAPATAGGTLEAAKVIVALSREWSLLTPQTAFLVLETEADYHTWNVPRQGRRRYWSAQDVPTVQPLPADWLAKIQPSDRDLSGRNTKVTGVVELDQQLEVARKALEAQNYQLVDQILDSLQTNKIALASDQYRNLRRITLNRRGIALYHLGIKQGWFDLEQIRLPLPTGTDRLLTNYGAITAELLERHPFAEQLLQEISLPVGEMSLFEFSQFLKTTLGVNIYADSVRLEEESVNQNTRYNLPPLKKLSVQNAVHHVLNRWNLTLVEEPRRLVITTKTEAIEHRKRVLFPVQDLIAKDPKFDFDDLQDPIFDREQQILQRIETKLKKLTSVHLKGASLEDLIARMRQELDENILIDKVKLAEESVATDATDISCDYDNATLGDVLTWLLDSKNLTYQVDHEALVLTTKTEAISRRPVRVYSAHGLIFRDAKSKAGQPRAPSQWGGWGMGMGGMWGGGFGGGFGGGMGGFGGGGMSGMGGGFGGGGNIGPAPLLDAFASDSEESATTQPGNAQPPQAEAATDQQVPLDGFSNPTDDDVGSLMQGVMQQTGGPPNSPWMEADGEGGDAAFFYPSLSFVFRQTPEAHAEITEYFRQQRALQSKRGTNPSMVPIGPRDALSRDELDVQALLMLIQQTTGGPPDSPWMEQAGQGGHVVYDRPRMALSITQHASALDEISGVLVRLRRERYALMHQSRPWEQTTFLGRQPGLFDGPWLTRTLDQGELAGPANEPELAALQVRRQLTGGQWTWTDATQTMSSNFTLSTAADRLQLAWQGWEVRLQGMKGSAYAPQLQYAELGTWGNAVRDWLDVELVFWPHRSNRDLATLFDVVPVPAGKQDGPNQVRLQFTPAKLERLPLWIHVVYDKTTGLPVVWESFRQGAVVQRFRFLPEVTKGQLVRMTVRQESPDGQLLGTGEWKPETQEVTSISDPGVFPEGTLTVDRRPQSRAVLTSFETGWQLLRKGDAVLAEAEFRKVLNRHPGHPLAQFLLAWSLNRQVSDVPEDQLLAAYATVVQQGPSDLARTLTRLGSGRFSERQLYELLNTRPLKKRDLLDEVTLAKQSLQLSDPEAALVHAQGAWKQQPAAGSPRLEVAQLIVQSQLRIGNLSGALAHYELCSQDPQFTPAHLMLVLETFEYYDRARDIASLYQELLQRKDPSITVGMRRSLLKKYADVTTDVKRWQALLAAIDLLPADSPDTDGELNSLADELTAAQDSVATAALALQTKSLAHRERLQHIQANLSKDLKAAQKLYWQLHQAGYLFRDQPVTVASRLIEAKHPEQAVVVLEALIRNRKPLTTAQRRVLAEAYTLTNRPLDAQRAISE